MGYYTSHELMTSDDNVTDHALAIAELAGENTDLLMGDPTKWYEHEKHMREYSKKYPDVLFTIIGEGGSSGDLWKEYYRNGLMQNCTAKIVYEPFDESLLK